MKWTILFCALMLIVAGCPQPPDDDEPESIAGLPDHQNNTAMLNWATAMRDTVKAAQWRFFADPTTPHRFLQCLTIPDTVGWIDFQPISMDTTRKPTDEEKSWAYIVKNVPIAQRKVWGQVKIDIYGGGFFNQGYILTHKISYDTMMPVDSVYYRTFGERLKFDLSNDCVLITTEIEPENTMSQWELMQ